MLITRRRPIGQVDVRRKRGDAREITAYGVEGVLDDGDDDDCAADDCDDEDDDGEEILLHQNKNEDDDLECDDDGDGGEELDVGDQVRKRSNVNAAGDV